MISKSGYVKEASLRVQSEPLQAEESAESRTNAQLEELGHEIEYPRCFDIMTLSSEFDRLGYFCECCSFLLYLT